MMKEKTRFSLRKVPILHEPEANERGEAGNVASSES